jgi:crotonobetainyl-CoA:carnitine CoA-transferase CaiB-like acyl-CoA transferase
MGGPLDGIRAIVLTQAWAGSLSTELLALMGAEVVQIEARRRLDSWRGSYDGPIPAGLRTVPTAAHSWNCSPNFNAVNLSKQELTLDLQSEVGIALFRGLIPYADIMVENFSPRVVGNLGIDYEALTAIKPDLIMCSLSAYGADGPWRNIPGIGGTIEPTSGQSGLLGYVDGPPLNSGRMFPDGVAGTYGFAALVTALHYRNRTGRGQYIDLSMQESNYGLIGDAVLEQAITGNVRPRMGNRHLTFAPHGIYPALGQVVGQALGHAAGEEHWVALAAESEQQWAALCVVAERPQWASDARFGTNEARKQHEDELDAEIAAWTVEQERDAAVAALQAAGVVAAPVLDGFEVAADATFRARGYVQDVDHAEAGAHAQFTAPFRLSGTPLEPARAAPLMGEHSEEVLSRFLDIDHGEYERLVESGVTGEGPPPGYEG